jgi:cytochrome c biogenesis protein CcdA
VINDVLQHISTIIQNNIWLAPLLSVAAGILTSFTPCSLSTVPLVIGYVGGVGTDTRKAFRLSLTFAVGSAITFTVLGTVAATMGNLISNGGGWWYIVLGVLMVLMALQTWEVFNFIPNTALLSKNKKRNYVGALLAGILAGVFSSPCATPVLIALLAIVAGSGNVIWGMSLLLFYSIGHGALAVIAGTSTGFVKKLAADKRYEKASRVIKVVMGSLIMLIGFYMFYLGF